MTAFLMILGVLLLIGVTKVGISVKWGKVFSLRLRIGPVAFPLWKEQNKAEEKQQKETKKRTKTKKNPWIKLLLQHWREVLSLISRILHTPRVDHFSLKLTFGGKDQADAALNYGRACAASGVLLPFLTSLFQINEKNIQIRYDPEITEIFCTGAGTVTVRIYQLFILAAALIRFAYRLYKELPNSQKVV